MALSEPFSIGPEQGEVHRNVGLLIVRQPRVYQASFSSRRWWGGPRRLSYSYPPVLLLLLITPLALMAHVPALLAWLAAGWYAFYRALRLAMPGQGALLLALAAPAVFVNAVGGQNGTWTAALFGGGLSLLERRPLLAGGLLGLLIYKPQLGLLIPVALLAGGIGPPPRVSRSP